MIYLYGNNAFKVYLHKAFACINFSGMSYEIYLIFDVWKCENVENRHKIRNKIRYLIQHTYYVLSFDAAWLWFRFEFFVCLVCTLNENDRQWIVMLFGLQWPLERIRIFFIFVFSLSCWFALNRRMRMTVCYDLLVFHSIWPFFKLNGSGTLLIVFSTEFWYVSSTSLFLFSFIVDSFRLDGHFAASQHTMNQKKNNNSQCVHINCDFNVRLSNSENKME